MFYLIEPFSGLKLITYGILLWYFCPCRFVDNIGVQEEAIALIACLATDVELVWHQSAVEGIHGMILNAMSNFPDQASLCEISLEALGEYLCPREEGGEAVQRKLWFN